MATCGLCKNKIDRMDEKKIECALCHNYYHSKCLQLTSEEIDYMRKEKKIWKCNVCVNSRRNNVTNTSPPISPVCKNINNNHYSSTYDSFVKTTNTKFDSLNEKVNTISKSIDEIKNLLSTKFREIEENLLTTINALKNENDMLKEDAKKLHCRIDDLEQQNLTNCIDIVGLPSIDDPIILKDTIKNVIVETLKIPIQDEHIEVCYKKNISLNAKNNNIVFVKFNSLVWKNKIMKNKSILRQKKPEIYIGNDKKCVSDIYLNHSLTFKKRMIFKEAKKVKNEFNIKYLWLRNGTICMRENDKSKTKYIHDIMDLDH